MDSKQIKRFNIRLYGILYSDDNQYILLSNEQRYGRSFTKFPGGGLEFGEGILDALKREFHEELSIEILEVELFYTNDFLQVSAFSKEEQLVSIYYIITSYKGIIPQPISNQDENKFDGIEIPQVFKWIAVKDINEDDLTFPIDKIVANQLKT